MLGIKIDSVGLRGLKLKPKTIKTNVSFEKLCIQNLMKFVIRTKTLLKPEKNNKNFLD